MDINNFDQQQQLQKLQPQPQQIQSKQLQSQQQSSQPILQIEMSQQFRRMAHILSEQEKARILRIRST
ncbi:hypothetical protein Glove_267g82 [Diversispora epigaea]|uniref:Uncharacterized protein n=1 Tax=Diversispora epigaea TaxID=1348612 RepID=A0A397I511_9GLOM|nr:hypothetical protein Glove_267g82 [Diversispora epigaea]